jgi:translocation and assembly module TamB
VSSPPLAWRIDLASASVETDEAALETLEVALSGSDLDASDPSEEIPATLTATVAKLSPKADAAAGFAGPLRLSGAVTLAPETFTAEIASFETEFAPFALSANGTVGLDEIDAELTLTVSDLARLSIRRSRAR